MFVQSATSVGERERRHDDHLASGGRVRRRSLTTKLTSKSAEKDRK